MKLNKEKIITLFKRQGVAIVFIILCVIVGSYNKNFFTISNFLNVFKQLSICGIFAWTITLLFIGGLNDLAGGSVMALSGVVVALMIVKFESSLAGVILGILLALVVGVAIGLISGFVIAKYHLPAFIVTLTMQNIARGMALVISKGKPISSMPESFKWLGQGYILGIPVPVYILILTFFVIWFLLYKTRFGRHVFAMGGNEAAAIAAGINVSSIKIISMMLSGLFSAIAGVVLASRLGCGQPNAAVGYEFSSMTMVILGGTSLNGGVGSLTGTIVGALIVGFMSNILNFFNVNVYFQQVVQGIVILVAVLLDANIKRNGKKKAST